MSLAGELDLVLLLFFSLGVTIPLEQVCFFLLLCNCFLWLLIIIFMWFSLGLSGNMLPSSVTVNSSDLLQGLAYNALVSSLFCFHCEVCLCYMFFSYELVLSGYRNRARVHQLS